jgi:hypothetical protein
MLFYVMLSCHVMLYVMLFYVMLSCHVMLLSFQVMSCHVMLFVMLFMSCRVVSCRVMPCYLCYIMLCYVMLCYFMLCYVTLRYVTFRQPYIFSWYDRQHLTTHPYTQQHKLLLRLTDVPNSLCVQLLTDEPYKVVTTAKCDPSSGGKAPVLLKLLSWMEVTVQLRPFRSLLAQNCLPLNRRLCRSAAGNQQLHRVGNATGYHADRLRHRTRHRLYTVWLYDHHVTRETLAWLCRTVALLSTQPLYDLNTAQYCSIVSNTAQ